MQTLIFLACLLARVSSDTTEYASQGWTPKPVKIYCTTSVVEMLPFYRDMQDIFLPVLIAADDLHNCYHIWYTPQYITLYVVSAIGSDEMVEAKIL